MSILSIGWDVVGKAIGGIAPVLGMVLGGPLGAAGGTLLSSALGVANEPGAVLAAIEKGGEAVMAAISSSEESAKAKWGYLAEGVKSDATQSTAINATMQAEIAKGVSWWHWRHLIGYVTLLWAFAPLPFVCAAMFVLIWQGKAEPLNAIVAAMTAMVTWLCIIAGLNGYVALDTSRRQSAALTGTPIGSLLGSVLGMFGKK